MTGAELAARRTAAAAVLANYQREVTASLRTPGTGLEWEIWAGRLASTVGQLLDITGEQAADAELLRGAVLAGNYDLSTEDVALVLDALDVAADYKRDRAANCPDCEASPSDLCGTCEWRLHVADGYDDLARRIGGTQ
jgi:hypothetical protein